MAVLLFFGSTLLSTALSTSYSVSLWGDVPGQDSYGAYTVFSYGLREPFPRHQGVAEAVVGEAASQGLLLHAGFGGVDGVDGDTIMLSVVSGAEFRETSVPSIDRYEWLRRTATY